jgi:broad-specificity NMP kinase
LETAILLGDDHYKTSVLILASIRHEISKAFKKRWYPDAKKNNNVGFEVFTAVAEKSFSFWNITLCIPMETDF